MQLHCLNTQQSKDSLSCTNQYFSVTIYFKTNVMVPHRKQTAISEAPCFRVAEIAGKTLSLKLVVSVLHNQRAEEQLVKRQFY